MGRTQSLNGFIKDAPFADNSSIVEIFTDLTVGMGIRRIIEKINSNAVAA